MNRAKAARESVNRLSAEPQPKERVRDRIVRTAGELFYLHGIHAVGVDMIATDAGTNKMSFYRNFASKDELVAECLRGAEAVAWQWWDEMVAENQGNPRAQIDALFALLVKKTCSSGSRGCALANAAVEITELDHPARPVIEKFKAEMRRRFRELARAIGTRDSDALGDSLMLLWEGSYLTRLTFRGQHGPAEAAAKAARALIAAHTP